MLLKESKQSYLKKALHTLILLSHPEHLVPNIYSGHILNFSNKKIPLEVRSFFTVKRFILTHPSQLKLSTISILSLKNQQRLSEFRYLFLFHKWPQKEGLLYSTMPLGGLKQFLSIFLLECLGHLHIGLVLLKWWRTNFALRIYK